MREIKFRFWDKDEKEMIYGINEGLMRWKDTLKNGADELLNRYWFFPVMQYTGLKDKNGKEIWEGDIIEYEWTTESQKYKNKVLWDDVFAGFNPFVKYNDDEQMYVEEGTLEVIGNIYENPKMLGKKRVPETEIATVGKPDDA